MPKLTDHENLVKQSGNKSKNWYIKIQVPKDIRHYFGKPQIWISTKTADIKVARLKRDQVVTDYKLKFRAYREGGTPEVIQDKINEGRKILSQVKDEMDNAIARRDDKAIDNLDHAYDGLRDKYQYEIEQLIAPKGIPNVTGVNDALETATSEEDLNEKLNPKLAQQFYDVNEQLVGKDAPVTIAIDEWYKEYSKTVKLNIAKQAKREVEYLAEHFDKVSQINYDSIATYIKKLRSKGNKGNKGNDKQTINKKFNWLRNYWRYLQQEKIITRTNRIVLRNTFVWETPFDGHNIPTIASDYTDVLHYEPEEMLKIWRYIRENKSQEMLEITTAQMFTGARVSELIANMIDDCLSDTHIMIQRGKTARARRQVPIHPLLSPLIKALKPKGYFKVKAKDISQAFRPIREACGFVDDPVNNTKYDMHSIRHTVITLMDRAQIADSTIEQIVGQKPKSVMRKHYSGGLLIEDKLKAITTVQYPFTKEETDFVMNGLK